MATDLTTLLHDAGLELLASAGDQDDELAATLPADRFCDDDCRRAFAVDLRYGLAAGTAGLPGVCLYCGSEVHHEP